MPFAASRDNGILTLTLDSPGAGVNVLNRATAAQLRSIMLETSTADTRAVVIRTAKANSFINGVGLMIAQATRNEDDAARLTECVRDAYQSLWDCPVPVIAAVQGNCYGCGVEFLLHCKYRIAADTQETHFYMTELADYLLIPVFRSTQLLPHQVGLDDSIRLLLWGEKWNAARAAERGLINAVADPDAFDAQVDGFVRRVLAGGISSCLRRASHSPDSVETLARAAHVRIESLPSVYRPVYRECLDLLVGAAAGEGGPDHHAREMAASGRSSASEICKSAFGFFYVRQMARHLPAVGVPEVPPVAVVGSVQPYGPAAEFVCELSRRRVPGVRVKGCDPAAGRLPPPAEIRFADPDSPSHAGDVAVQLSMRHPAAGRLSPPAEIRSADPDSPSHAADVAVQLSMRCPAAGRIPPPAEIRSADPDSPSHAGVMAVQLSVREPSVREPSAREDTPIVVYSPLFRTGSRFVELATRRRGDPLAAALTNYLSRAGFTVALSRPAGEFGIDRMIAAYLRPVLRYLATGGSPATVVSSLREFGFVRGPWDLWDALRRSGPPPAGFDALDRLSHARVEDAPCHRPLVDAVCLSLLSATPASPSAAFYHPVLADLAARELLDFPLLRGSLCKYLTRRRVESMLQNRDVEPLLTLEDLRLAAEFVHAGKELYR